ncbi:MAG: T9SS type A sorting domain-containing protein, partial [Bacteroidota bacterium]
KDTLVAGKACQQIEEVYRITDQRFGEYIDYEESNPRHVYLEDSILYVYADSMQIFDTLYNFKAKAGDSWGITRAYDKQSSSPLQVSVQVTGDTVINGKSLRWLGVDYSGPFYEPSSMDTIIWSIGSLRHFMFPWYGEFAAVDGPNLGPITCYEDDDIGMYIGELRWGSCDGRPLANNPNFRWGARSAVWHYECSVDGNDGYIKYSLGRDTMIQNRRCQQVIKETVQYSYVGGLQRTVADTRIMNIEDSVLYLFNQELEAFDTIWNFKAPVGTSWQLSVDNAEVSDIEIKVLYSGDTTLLYPGLVPKPFELPKRILRYRYQPSGVEVVDTVLYQIGSLNLTMYPWDEPELSTSNIQKGPLRCYQDYFASLKIRKEEDCDFLPTSVNELPFANLQVFPSPARNRIFIQTDVQTKDLRVGLLDVSGRLVYETEQWKDGIDIAALPPALYFLVLSQNGQIVGRKKIVKQ